MSKVWYFKSMNDAYCWLEFDCNDLDREHYSYAYPDQFCEWARWKRLYDAGVQELV